MASGEGYGADLLAARAASVVGVEANPDAFEHARLRYRRAEPALRALAWSRSTPSRATRSCSCRRSSTCRTRARCSSTSRRCSRRAALVFVSTPNVLTLAPPGAERSGNPWHVREYRPEEFARAVRGALRPRRAATASSTRASSRCTRSRSTGSGGTRSTRRLGLTRALLRPLRAGDLGARLRAARRARPRPRARPRGGAAPMTAAAAWRSSCTRHMPYVEGFGTWPFGEEWLWEAVATSYLPLLGAARARRAAHAVADARCSATSSRRRARSTAAARSSPTCGPRRTGSTPRPRAPAATRRVAREIERAAGDYARALERAAGRPARARCARTRRGRARRRTRCSRCSRPTPPSACRCAPASPRTGRASARGAAASGCRSAATRRGSTRCSRRPGVHAVCVDLTDVLGRGDAAPAAPGRDRGRAAARADRPRDGRARVERRRLPGPRRLPRLPPPHRARPPPVGERRRGLRPGARRGAGAGGRRPTSSRGSATRVAGGGLAVCALDTELLGHWWHEGPLWLEAVLDAAAREGLEIVAARRRARGRRPRAAARASTATDADDVGHAARPRHVVGPAGAAALAWAARVAELRVAAAGRRGAGPGAARAARCCSRATGRSSRRARSPAPYPRERAAAHRAALEAALAGGGDGEDARAQPRAASLPRGVPRAIGSGA